jgi:hypothetical protein
MPIPAAQLSYKGHFYKRALVAETAGTLGIGFEEDFVQWVALGQGRPATVQVGSWTFQAKTSVVTTRYSRAAAKVSAAWQVEVDEEVFEVNSVDPAADRSIVRFAVTSAPTRELYANEMELRGESVTVGRYDATAHLIGFPARAKVIGYQPSELVGGINQGDRRVLLLAEDLETNGLVLPLRVNDRILVRGKALNVVSIDDSTHRNAGVLNAYDLRVTGA